MAVFDTIGVAPPDTRDLYTRYEQDYGAPDKAFVLENIRKFGTDDRAKWVDSGTEGGFSTTPTSRSIQNTGVSGMGDLGSVLTVPGTTKNGPYATVEGVDMGKLNDPTYNSPKYTIARLIASGMNAQQIAAATGGTAIGSDKVRMPDGSVIDFVRDLGGANALQFLIEGGGNGSGQGRSGGSGSTPRGGSGITGVGGTSTTGAPSVSGNSVFDDPATTEWEQLLRSMVDKMNQSQPTWTPGQLELQQTQVLDPLEQQRQARKQQTIQQYAARGMRPGQSGIVDQALADIDRQFDQLRTTTQSGIANQAIQREDQLFQNNETRAMNAVNLMKQIPMLADSRLAGAQSSLQSPMQLISLLLGQQNSANQQSYLNQQQNQQFWSQIAKFLAAMDW